MNLDYEVIFNVLTIVRDGDMAGAKWKVYLCFKHAVEASNKDYTVNAEAIMSTFDTPICDVCVGRWEIK